MRGLLRRRRCRACAAQDDGIWPIPGQNLAGFRYSSLDQINAGNVKGLAVAWTFSLGVLRGQEAAPIVAADTMFEVTPYPNILYALDLTKPGAPLKWKHEPKPVAAAQGVACCGTANRVDRSGGRRGAAPAERVGSDARACGLHGRRPGGWQGDDLSHHLRYQEAKGVVGPPLERFAERVYIAGVPPNTPDNLVAWIRDPPGIDPLTAMAASGIGEA